MLPRRLAPVLPSPYSSSFLHSTKAKSFVGIWHLGSPRRDCSHCGGFAPAAPRRVWNLVSGSISGPLLSQPVQITGLVGHYPTNYLICRRPILRRPKPLNEKPLQDISLIRYCPQFPGVIPVLRVGYPRVTEPYATIQVSFNMHGLIEPQ